MGPLEHFHPNPQLPPKPTGTKPLTSALTLLWSRKAGKIITRGLLFPLVLLIPALLIPTHKILGTYFVSFFPLGSTGTMKYTNFCTPQGNQRVCFHFSDFLLAGLGNNEKTPRSCAGVTPFVQSHKAVGFLLNSWLWLRGISTTGPGWGDSYTSPRCSSFASAQCLPLPSAPHTPDSWSAAPTAEEMSNARHWELSAPLRWVGYSAIRLKAVCLALPLHHCRGSRHNISHSPTDPCSFFFPLEAPEQLRGQ